MKQVKGFTLIELMITVAILSIIMSVAIPAYSNYVTRGKITEATSTLSGMRVQMEQFFQDNRSYMNGPSCGIPNMPVTGKYFVFDCPAANLSPTAYVLRATGQGGMAGFVYTVDQSNNKTSAITAPGWSNPNPNNCWAIDRNGIC